MPISMSCTLLLDRDAIASWALDKYLRECRVRGYDMRPAWDDVLAELYLHEYQLFENEGRTTEHPRWVELSDHPLPFYRDAAGRSLGYKTWKSLHYPGRKILELTGKLKKQLAGLEPGAFVRRMMGSLTLGSNYPLPGGEDLGGLHAVGRGPKPGRVGRGGVPAMPARPPIRIDQPVIDKLCEPVLRHIFRWW